MPAEFHPVAHYDSYGEAEVDRLTESLYGQLEFEETVTVLESALPPEGHVLDVGCGPGRYTEWLLERGYSVTAVDPSERQLDLAKDRLAQPLHAGAVTLLRGEVSTLPLERNIADATLCLGGPLSHVLDANARKSAAGELARVTTDGGPVVVSVMGRLAALQTVIRVAGRDGVDETSLLPSIAQEGNYDDALLEETNLEPTAPPMHLFRAAELERLLDKAGMDVSGVTGLESVASQRRDDFDLLDANARNAIRETVAALRWDRSVADLSGHLLALARA